MNLQKILHVTFSFIFLLSLSLTAQTFEWAKNFGGIYNDKPIGMIGDGSGNIYVTGIYSPSIDFDGDTINATNTLGGEIYLAKIDENGQALWATTSIVDSGNAVLPTVAGIAADALGNTYLTGTFIGNFTWDGKSIKNTNRTSIWFAKFNSQGQLLWLKKAGYNDVSTLAVKDLAVTPSGKVYIGGAFWKEVTLGGQDLSIGANPGIFLAKFDSSGSLSWAESYSNPGSPPSLYGISTDNQENIYLTGSATDVTFDNHSTDSSKGAIYAVKLDGSGNSKWVANMGNKVGPEIGYAITTDNQGNVYVGGSETKNSTTTPGALVVKLNSTGQQQWNKQFPADNKADVFDLVANNAGHVFITGAFNGSKMYFGQITINNQGNVPEVFVAELDNNGTPLWAKAFGSQQDDRPNAIALHGQNEISIYGHFGFQIAGGPQNPTMQVGSTTLTSKGKQDMFVVKMQGTAAAPATVTLTAPTGSETWYIDSTYNISWTSSNVNGVNIQYSFGGQSNWTDIQTNVNASAGQISWKVPATTATTAWIRILDADNSSVGDTSKGAVTISKLTSVAELPGQHYLVISPNPFAADFNISYGSTTLKNASIKIFDATGRVVMEKEMNNHFTVVSAAALPSGIFYLHIYEEGQLMARQKLVKQ